MAPGPKLPSDSPMGKDIKRIVREMLREELSLEVHKEDHADFADSFSVHLKLGDEVIHKAYVVLTLEAGHYADDISFEVV